MKMRSCSAMISGRPGRERGLVLPRGVIGLLGAERAAVRRAA
jgi:hypothetical protein